MGPHVDEHSKRSRYLTGGNLSVNSQLLPLSIDVKKVWIFFCTNLSDRFLLGTTSLSTTNGSYFTDT
jgi:hypothetical protein